MRKRDTDEVATKIEKIERELEDKLEEIREKAEKIDAKTPLWKEVLAGVVIGLIAGGMLVLVMKIVGVI